MEPTLREDRFYVGDPQQDAQGASRKLPPDQARAKVHDWIRRRAHSGQATFSPTDDALSTLRKQCGMTSRGWIYKVLKDLVDRGVLTENRDRSTTYTIVDLGPLDGLDQRAA